MPIITWGAGVGGGRIFDGKTGWRGEIYGKGAKTGILKRGRSMKKSKTERDYETENENENEKENEQE